MKRKPDATETDEAERTEKKKMKKQKKSAKKEIAEKGPTEKGDNLEHSSTPTSSPKKKKKKKFIKEKENKDKKKKHKSASESSQDDDGSTSHSVESDNAQKKSGHSQSKNLADWSVEDYENLLHSLENLTEGGGLVYNKIPLDIWGNVSVGDHSPEACQTAWAKICQVVRNRMTLEQMLLVIKDMLGSPKHQQIMSILVGKKNMFPGAPQTHLVNNYQLYTRRRLTEIPKPSFKDIGLGWKSLSEEEKKEYHEEAEKINKKVKKEIEEYMASLSPEMKQRYMQHHKQAKSLFGKKNTFPGAPQTHLVNSYQLYTSKRLAETPQPTFKDIGLGWKSLSEEEKEEYHEEAEKMNKKIKREIEDYMATLSPEMKEKYLEHLKHPKSYGQKLKKEFADAPKTTHTNSYNVYTRERLAEKPHPSFKEIASCWKTMSEAERKPYQTQADEINAETKKNLEEYIQSLSEDERKRFLKKKEKKQKKTPLPKKSVLGQRNLKRAEVQYLMEEKDSAIQQNPGVEEEEILQRLAEAFRALDYDEQKSYLQRAKESASEQKKITEFYKKSPLVKSKQRQPGKIKPSQKSKEDSGRSSESSTDDSSDEEVMKKSVMKPPVKALVSKSSASPANKVIANAKSSKKVQDSDSSSDDSSDEEVTKKSVKKPPVKALVSKSSASPEKTVIANAKSSKKDYDSDSSSVSSSGSSSDHEVMKKLVVKPPVKAHASKTNSSTPTKKQIVNSKSPVKASPQKKTPAKVVKEDSSSSDSSSSDEEEDKAKGKASAMVSMSPTKRSLASPAKPVKKKRSSSDSSSSDEGEAAMIPVSPKKKSISTPTKTARRKSSSSESSSDDDEEKTAKGKMSPVIPATPSSSKKRPHPKSSSSSSASSSSDDSDNDNFTSSQKKPPPPKILHSQKKSINTPSSLKSHKKKQK